MRRAVLFCAAIVLAIACGDNITEPIPDRTPATPKVSFATTTTEDGVTITTDKDDYAPGDTVHFTGTGWQPGDVLDIVLVDEPQTHDPHTWSVNVGEDGTFHDSTYVVDAGDVGVTFTLTATSRATGRSLTVNFTDANVKIDPSPAGVSFVLSIVRWSGANCSGNSNAAENEQQTVGPSGITLQTFNNNTNTSTRPQSFTLTAAAASTLGAAFVNWTKDANTSATINGAVVCISDQGGGPNLIANYNGAPDLKLVKTTVGTFGIGSSNAAFGIEVQNTGTATAQGTSQNRITVTDALLSGLTPPANFSSNNWDCTISGQNVTCRLVAGQSIAPGASRTFTIPVGITAGVCPTVTNSATVGGGNEPAGKVDAENTGTITTSIAGCNGVPTAAAGGPYSGAEGSAIALNQATATDPDAGDVLLYSWTSSSTNCTFSAPNVLQPSITCTDNGSYTATLSVDDQHGHVVTSAATVNVANVNPTATFNSPITAVDEGSSFTLSLTGATDVSSVDVTAGLKYAFDCGEGYPATVTDYASASMSNSVSCHTAVDGPGSGPLSVRGKVFDKDDGFTEYTGSVEVKNLPPTATFEAPSYVNEGSSFTLKLNNATDPSTVDQAAGLHFTFDCGDGSGYQNGYASAGMSYSITCHTAVDGPGSGPLSVRGKVFDKDEGYTEYSGSVTVNNVPPTITSVTANPSGQLVLGSNNQVSTNITVAFTDPATTHDEPYATSINCDNGSPNVTGSPTTHGSSAGVCTYTAANVGFRTIRATVTDKDNGTSAEVTTQVQVIYNWTGFFQPVDNNNLNVAKAGSAIPVKFNLGGYQGLGIFASGSPAWPNSSKVNCDAINEDQDTIEETVNAGGSSLTYDASASQYIYVWKTEKTTWVGQCRRLDVKLIDGTTHSAYFKFKN